MVRRLQTRSSISLELHKLGQDPFLILILCSSSPGRRVSLLSSLQGVSRACERDNAASVGQFSVFASIQRDVVLWILSDLQLHNKAAATKK